MSRARIAVLSLVAVVAFALTALAGASVWIFYTASGLTWLSARLSGFAGEGLTLEGVSGTLAGGARIQGIRYAGPDIELRVTDAWLAVSPLSIIKLSPRISDLGASEVGVTTKPTEPRGRPPDSLELPASFRVDTAFVGRLVLDMGEGPLDVSNVRISGFSGGKSRHTLDDLSLSAFDYAVALKGTIDAQAPFGLSASFAAVPTERSDVSAAGRLGGNLSAIAVEAAGRAADGRLTATATLTPYADLPLSALSVAATGIDLHAVLDALPHTALRADIKLELASGRLRGPVEVTNGIAGPYDQDRLPLTALKATVASNLTNVGFTSLIADLGKAGSISGSGEIDANIVRLTLTTKRLDLSALHTRIRQTRLAGRADITLQQARQSVTANLTQDGISISATAHRGGDNIEIPTFRVSTRGGVARGEGRVSLADARPFSVEAHLERFDPSAWGDFPAGLVNATLSASGNLTAPAAEARFAIDRSRWLGAPLAGSGRVRLRPDRLEHADVSLTLGGNRVSATGAFGAPRDTLHLRINAPNLSLVDRALRGTIHADVQLGGTFASPRARFDAKGARLAHRDLGRLNALAASGVVDLDPKGSMQARASFGELVRGDVRLRSGRVELDGTRANHSALVLATGDRVDFRLRARGGYAPTRGWNGTLLELVNRGDASIELLRPVALSVSATRVHLEPFELRALGGQLIVSALDYTKGSIATTGGMENFPVVPALSLIGPPKVLRGDLRVSGSWNLRSTPQLSGSVSIARAGGDVVVGEGRGFMLQLEELGLTANFARSGATVAASVRSALAVARVDGRIGAVGSGALPYGAGSPVDLAGTAQVARLAPFAAFIDTPMLVGGQAAARVQVRGTIGKPAVTGGVTAQRLNVALPVEGISLNDGALVATLTEREIRIESFSIRGGTGVLSATGTLAREGFNRASLDWRAEQLTALARPDRRLVVSGAGNAALEQGRLSLTGKLRANEGEFELGGPSDLPTLSTDIVIVGRTKLAPRQQDDAPARFERLALEVSIDLGNQVHVAGHGLSVWLSGALRVFTNAQGEIRASGTVNARNGTFVAYGQRLEIDRGRLYFNGPIANPALDIVAMRRRQAVEVGVAVTGTLRTPLVRVVSDPPLPQGEALSWLVLGRPAGEAGAGELSALPLATGVLAGKVTDPLAKRLRLDELGFRGGGAGDQFLTLGKRITDRLYIMFEQGLGAAESLLRLEYSLTRRVLLRVQAGEPTSAGVFYRRSWD